MPKSRVLCLHGGASNDDITRFQTMGLQLSERFECVYQHAPHSVEHCYPGLARFSDGPWYAWADPNKSLSDQEEQWDESLEYLAKFCMQHGPFDGVYGFSQGAAMITNFSHPKIWKERFQLKHCPWKFAILACGGASQYLTIKRGGTTLAMIEVPSFHIFGKRDHIFVDSKRIAEFWDPSQKTTHAHGRGHEIDMQMHTREMEMMVKLNNFLDGQLSSKKYGSFPNLSLPKFHLMGYSFGGTR